MYLLTIRDGLVTRHVGPYESPKQAVDDLDQLLKNFGERARWQIHELESPEAIGRGPAGQGGHEGAAGVSEAAVAAA